MTRKKIIVPSRLTFQNSINFVKNLRALEPHKEFNFDFSNLVTIDPFSLLLVSSEIQRCRSRLKESNFIATNFEHCSYSAHMGFFQAFGMNYGKRPGEAKGSSTYIPINIYNTQEIKQDARDLMINPAELLESKAKEISNVLTRSESGNLNEVLTYCIREIFRNVIEHSHSEQFGFCAQYRPSLNRVSFSIIDRGIGLKESLEHNPTLDLKNDEEAIRAALKPATSGKVYRGQKNKPKGEWANSGYGLFMTSNICKRGGGFFIASGDVGYYTSENKERILETPFIGTALNLALDTNRIKDLYTMLREIDNNDIKSKIKPSKSSMGLMNKE
jgi:anti-sigma regulatory factor (Ser/Thr protein kinase)